MKKDAKTTLAAVIFFLVSAALIGFLMARTLATSSITSNNANLTIWDDTFPETGFNKYSLTNVSFFANYTNETTGNAILDGNCTIRFENYTNDYGDWVEMAYNSTYSRFQYNRTFNYKGTYRFEINCSNSSSYLVNVTDNYTITNKAPSISLDDGGSYIDFDGNPTNNDYWSCSEDTLCIYNFSSNVTEIDINDVLVFGNNTANTTLVNFTLYSSTGILEMNVTIDANAGSRQIELNVRDTESSTQSGILRVNITATNDAPIFSDLENQTFNMSELFENIVTVTDEENDIPFSLNITFLNCSVAAWSTRNCSNSSGRILFNSSQYSFNGTTGILNISFTPGKNDVGSYIINFTVTDLNNTIPPYNASTSQIVNFTVLNINSPPYFTYVCNNKRNATEDGEFTCWINVTDIDETNNLTFTANYTWFSFNGTGSNSATVTCNLTTSYNASVFVNFTPTDIAVGNWSINVSVLDTGSPERQNSTVFWFFINNTEDTVSLNSVDNYTIYLNTTIHVNATDDDLLVPDANVKDEVLTFASNTSWVSISTDLAPDGVNYTQAKIEIDFDTANSYGDANHTIKINVTDTTGNTAERVFILQILGDNAPQWGSMGDTFIIYENNNTYMNFSKNVTDADDDPFNFTFINDTSFPSFSLGLTTGIINFTSIDEDVGYHNVTITVNDGKLNTLKSFNFTILNVNDDPYLETPPLGDAITINSTNSNMNTTEDSLVYIYLWIEDDDFKIPNNQKDFYNESLSVDVNISGPNSTLLEFSGTLFIPPNRTQYTASFTPGKSDVGVYNITLNISDASNASVILQFNLTINETDHGPVLMDLTNQTSLFNSSFYYRINATDAEDGDSTTAGNTNFTFRYSMLSGDDIFNETTFNSTTGEINMTFNLSHVGSYYINVTVNDTTGLEDSGTFWLYIYGSPNITFPGEGQNFTLQENETSNLVFRANHGISDNLTYEFYLDGSLKYNISYYGNDTNLTWQFTPNFTDETYGQVRNLTLIVLNPSYSYLNASRNWNVTISHKNAPVIFSGTIGSSQADYSNTIDIDLSSYFSDPDYSDQAYNQSVSFNVISNSSPSYITASVSGWTLTLSSVVAVTELLRVNGTDINSSSNLSLTSALSNAFEIRFTTPTTTPVPTPSEGGGSSRPVLLKLILPDPVSAYKRDRIEIPIVLSNEGTISLSNIDLAAMIAKDNVLIPGVVLSFDQSHFTTLKAKQKKNVTLIAEVNTDETGLYEITINASVKTPRYVDWGKLYLTVKEANKSEVEEKLIFTEEFIAENPECIEIKEIVDEARAYFERGDYTASLEKSREAVDACRYAISQPALSRIREKFEDKLYRYLSLTSLVAFIIAILYFIYRRVRFKRAGENVSKDVNKGENKGENEEASKEENKEENLGKGKI